MLFSVAFKEGEGVNDIEYKNLGNVIPINRAIITRLNDILTTVDEFHLRKGIKFNATLINFDGFMRQDIVYNTPEILKVPKRKPVSITTEWNASLDTVMDVEYMVFKLNRWQSTRGHLVYREVKE